MSREAFEACVNAFWDGDVGHLTPNDCLHAVWPVAQADAFERAAKVCRDQWYAADCVDAIIDLAKES